MTAKLVAVTMPKWGLAMTEGKVTAWLAGPGAAVTSGQPLLEIETSKISNEYEAPSSGVLLRRLVGEGETVSVGDILGVIGDQNAVDPEVDAFVAEFQAAFVPPEESGEDSAAAAYQTIRVAGRLVRYQVAGSGEAPPLLLIHGFGGDLNNWLFNQIPLSARRRVLALDLPGHGGTEKSLPGPAVADLAAFVWSFCDGLDLPRLHLAGHSLGGAIALAMALARPAQVASLTLIAAAGLGPEINRGYIDGFVAAERRKELKPVVELLFADPSAASREMIDDILKYKRLDGVAEALTQIAGACFTGAAPLAGGLSELTMPVQAIWGEADAIIPASQAGLVARHHLLPGAGHMVHMEAATAVNALIAGIME